MCSFGLVLSQARISKEGQPGRKAEPAGFAGAGHALQVRDPSVVRRWLHSRTTWRQRAHPSSRRGPQRPPTQWAAVAARTEWTAQTVGLPSLRPSLSTSQESTCSRSPPVEFAFQTTARVWPMDGDEAIRRHATGEVWSVLQSSPEERATEDVAALTVRTRHALRKELGITLPGYAHVDTRAVIPPAAAVSTLSLGEPGAHQEWMQAERVRVFDAWELHTDITTSLLRMCSGRMLQAGEPLVSMYTPADHMFIVLRGALKLEPPAEEAEQEEEDDKEEEEDADTPPKQASIRVGPGGCVPCGLPPLRGSGAHTRNSSHHASHGYSREGWRVCLALATQWTAAPNPNLYVSGYPNSGV